MPPDFFVAGHIVKDIVPGGFRIGGTVAYAALQAQRLGCSVAAVTSCAPEISPAEIVPGVQWHVVPSYTTTTFENSYTSAGRSQRLLEVATSIGPGHIPAAWCQSPLVLLGPVFQELDPETGCRFPPESTVGLVAQGWLRLMRGVDLLPGPFEPHAGWLTGDVVIVSEEDMETPERANEWLEYVRHVVLTRGAAGCTLWNDDGRHEIPAFPARTVDPTGAGDAFAAAFLVRLKETGDAVEAARFGSAAGALTTEGHGLEAVPHRAQVEALLATAGARL